MNYQRRIIIVDDEPIIRTLLSQRLTSEGFEVFTAASALEAKKMFAKVDPDAMVVDLDLGDGPSGTDLIAALSSANAGVGFLLLTNYTPTPSEMKSAPHIAYLSKRAVETIAVLVDALNTVMRDDDPRTELFQVQGGSPLSKLTPKQLQVLKLVAKGHSNAEIARQRDLGVRAVEQTVHRIYQALEIGDDESTSPRVLAARIYSAQMGLRQGTAQ
jgi:DNA-binding NarL/FixJ family response regulator